MPRRARRRTTSRPGRRPTPACAVGSGRAGGVRPPYAGHGRPRARGPRRLAICRRHRQPDRQDGGSKAGFRGYHAGRRINGRKRHILTDADGRLRAVEVHGADIQDRDGAKGVLQRARPLPLRREGPRRPPGAGGAGQDPCRAGDREAPARGQRLRRPPPPLGRRADLRVDHEMPPTRPRLRTQLTAVAETRITIAAIATLLRRPA